MKKILLLCLLFLVLGTTVSAQVGPPPICEPPINLTVFNVTTTSAEFAWVDLDQAIAFDIYIQPAGLPAPTVDAQGVFVTGIPVTSYIFSGLSCGFSYDVYVRISPETCSSIAPWSFPVTFTSAACFEGGAPLNLAGCPSGGESCFDLTVNDAAVLGTLDPGQYDVGYFANYDDAVANTNAITTTVCISAPLQQHLYARVTENATANYWLSGFSLLSQTAACPALVLNAFYDNNANGIQEPDEPGFSHGSFEYERNNDGNLQTGMGSNGQFLIYESDTSNSYNISFQIDDFYTSYFIAPSQYVNVSSPPTGETVIDFPVQSSAPLHEVGVALSAYGSPRPGFTYVQVITYTNFGSQTESGSLTYIIEPGFTIVDVNSPATVTPTGFTLDFTNLQPFDTRQILVTLLTPTIPTVQIGQVISHQATVVVVGDQNPDNDIAFLSETVIGSYDPNDKMEAHGPEIDAAQFNAGDDLVYTIRFENTGTAAAERVFITDILDSQLLAHSARLISSSHPCVMHRNGQNLSWEFIGINLEPVSATDPLLGHGYVSFSVKTAAGVGLGDVIPNEAAIYFDFNPAIVTPIFNSRFVEVLDVRQFQENPISLYPNPTASEVTVTASSENLAQIQIVAVSGQTVLRLESIHSKSKQIDVSHISSGLYFLKVTDQSGYEATRKLIVR